MARGDLSKILGRIPMVAGDPQSDREPLDLLADEYVARLRRGEMPPLGEYVERHPELAGEIRDLFPTLLMMEQLKPAAGDPPPDPSDGRSPARESPPVERLGEFRLLRVLGRGGMGIVYEAIQESLGRHVALKVLPPHGRLDATQLGRFRREARAAAGLHHSNIVPVFAVGDQDGVPYYAMQFIRGQSIDSILDDLRRLRSQESANDDRPSCTPGRGEAPGAPAHPATPEGDHPGRALTEAITKGILGGRFTAPPRLEPDRTESGEGSAPVSTLTAVVADGSIGDGRIADEAPTESTSLISQPGVPYIRTVARLGAQVADALAYAHAQGICHRDIKPSNLLLDTTGTVWVADFGLAKAEEGGGEELTHTGDVVGTLRYMAPERFNGRADARSDVYALGVTLYEMLTLRPAFGEPDRLKLIERISNEPVPGPRSIDPTIPGDLETVVLKAMAREPRERYASARALAEDLRRFLDDRTILARRSTAGERAWRWCRRNPAMASLNALAASLTVLVAVVSTVAALSYRGQLARTTKAERRARVALGASLLAEGTALQRTGLVGQRFESLDRLQRAAQELRQDVEGRDRLPEIRDQIVAALGLTDLRLRKQVQVGASGGVACDHRLERYAVVEPGDGRTVVRSLDDDRELFRTPRPELTTGFHPAFSPDGQYLLILYGVGTEEAQLDVWHLGRNERVFHQSTRRNAAFHPDGRTLVFESLDKDLVVWDLVGRRSLRRLPLEFRPSRLRFDPEGRRLAANAAGNPTDPSRVQILDTESGRSLSSWTENVGHQDMDWSHDGRLLAVSSWDGRVFVWDVVRDRLASVLQGHTKAVVGCLFSPVGYLLETYSWDATNRLWDAASGELLLELPRNQTPLAFSSDGRRLAFQDGPMLGIWEVAHGGDVRTINPDLVGNRSEPVPGVWSLDAAFSPDGGLVALATRDGVHLHDPETGRDLAHLKAGFCETVLFAPDGRDLFTSGEWGLFRWPIRADPAGRAGALRVGPPELLFEATPGGEWYRASWMADRRTIGMIDNTDGRIVLVDGADPHAVRSRPRTLPGDPDGSTTSVAFSPDGRWAALGNWRRSGISRWDLLEGRHQADLVPTKDSNSLVRFSPDGRWLVSGSNTDDRANSGYYFWEVVDWGRGPFIPNWQSVGLGAPAFSPDGQLVALCVSPQRILLAEAATGRTIAHLPSLQPLSALSLAFSPDGTKLIGSTHKKTALLWELRRIREELRGMDLDWDQPPFATAGRGPQAGATAAPTPPGSIRVVGELLEPSARRASDLTALDERLRSSPEDAEALIRRGWLRHGLRNLRGAIADFDRVRGLRPDDAEGDRLMGKVYLDAGDLDGALAAFDRALARDPGDRDSRLHRGLLDLALGRPGRAAADLGLVLALDPSLDRARIHRARALNRSGRFGEAVVELDALIARNPNDFAPYQARAISLDALGDHEGAQRDRDKAASSLPRGHVALNNRAWSLLTCPFIERDADSAVSLARVAVARAPDQQANLNTLGLALYRTREYRESVDVLTRSLGEGGGEFAAYDLFLLAMAEHALGRRAQARACLDRAVLWCDGHKTILRRSLRDLAAFRAEAEAVLDDPGVKLPADVFAPE